MPRLTRDAVIAACVCYALLLGAALVWLTPAPVSGPPQVTWERCAQEITAVDFECATLAVPLDHADPTGETIDVALIRTRAAAPEDRLGSLVVASGGLGVSGIESLKTGLTDLLPLARRYDLVAMDVRGVGASTPVTCHSGPEQAGFLEVDVTPDDAAERAFLADTLRAFAAACAARSGPIFRHLGTTAAAHDLERVRIALGEPRLHFLGFSYGAHLGAVYARLYPDRVGRFVLDGAVDTSLDWEQRARQRAAGLHRALLESLARCRSRGQCPIGDTPEEAIGRITGLLARLDATPLPVWGGWLLTEELALHAMERLLYNDRRWPQLWGYLAKALDGDGNPLLNTALASAGYQHELQDYDNRVAAGRVIGCADQSARVTFAQVRALEKELARTSPVFGRSVAWEAARCAGLPVAAAPAETASAAPGPAAPIVVVGTTGDPAAPYGWATRLAGRLGNAVLVTFEGEGHVAFHRPSECVRQVVLERFLDDQVPAAAVTCR